MRLISSLKLFPLLRRCIGNDVRLTRNASTAVDSQTILKRKQFAPIRSISHSYSLTKVLFLKRDTKKETAKNDASNEKKPSKRRRIISSSSSDEENVSKSAVRKSE